MFRIDWIERYLSRVQPRQVLAVWVPVAAWFAVQALRQPDLGPMAALGLIGAGLLAWTLLEYGLHRFVFHLDPDPGSEFQRDLAFLVHGVHHDWPHDADRLVMPPAVAAILAVVVGFPLRGLLGARLFSGVFAGLVAGYLWYDLTHYAVHHLKQRTTFGKLQRRNHMVHHFAQTGARFGVTTPIWDICFGTYPAHTARSAEELRPTSPEPASDQMSP